MSPDPQALGVEFTGEADVVEELVVLNLGGLQLFTLLDQVAPVLERDLIVYRKFEVEKLL